MNSLAGRITGIRSCGSVALAEIDVGGDCLEAEYLESSRDDERLAEGMEVQLLFKETEVVLGCDLTGLISIGNRLSVRVVSIAEGPVLSRLRLTYKEKELTSLISAKTLRAMNILPGDEIEALIAAADIMILRPDEAR